jgi:hypothetical protein
MTEYKQLVHSVHQMRQLQNEYRRTQTNAARLQAVHCEKYVDNLIENALDGFVAIQPELPQRRPKIDRLWKME